MRRLIVLVAGLVTAAAIAIPVTLAQTTKTLVAVKLKEFKVLPGKSSVAAGPVLFKVSDVGALPHELLVVKTKVAQGKLPVRNNKAVVKALGKVGPLKPGKSGTLVLTLKAGKYVLLCNVAGHYQAGQHAAFTVR
jgi:uncharacterized cupredoxin-like copper-binding protein